MREERVEIAAAGGGGPRLEGVLHLPEGVTRPACVLLLHPHPMGGGCMDVGLLLALAEVLTAVGFAALRFNFRGVGASEGRSTGSEAEVEDVAAAHRWLAERGDVSAEYPLAAGWSFGSWVGLRWALELGEPATLEPLRRGKPAGRTLIIAGERDQFSTPDALAALALVAGATLEILPGVDHFLFGHEREIARKAVDFLKLTP